MNYPLFQKFNNYYGYTDYADRIMEAGFATGKTDLKNGNIDFTGFSALGEEHGGKPIKVLYDSIAIANMLCRYICSNHVPFACEFFVPDRGD